MANIKLGDLYLSKEESKDIIELLAKKRNIKNYKSKASNRLYNIFKKQSKNKKRIDDIREELKNPKYNISKSESKDIKGNLYNIEKQRKTSLKETSQYLDELDKRILRLSKYHDYDDFEYKGITIIEEYKLKGEWKVQLTIEVNFISLKPGSDETRIMYTRSDNIEIMFGDDNDDIIEQLFESLLQKYEEL